MLYVIVDSNGNATDVAFTFAKLKKGVQFKRPHDWKSYSEADTAVKQLNKLKLPCGPFEVTYDVRLSGPQGDSKPINIQIKCCH